MPGEHEDGNRHSLQLHLAEEIQPIGIRKLEVQQGSIKWLIRHPCQRVRAAIRFLNLYDQVTGLERAAGGAAIQGIIVYNQYSQWFFHSRSHGSSLSIQYLLSVAIVSTKLLNVTGLRI